MNRRGFLGLLGAWLAAADRPADVPPTLDEWTAVLGRKVYRHDLRQDAGSYTYVVTYVTADGETLAS